VIHVFATEAIIAQMKRGRRRNIHIVENIHFRSFLPFFLQHLDTCLKNSYNALF